MNRALQTGQAVRGASPTASPYTASRSVLIVPPGEYSFCIIVPEKEIADKAGGFFGKGNKNRRKAVKDILLLLMIFRIISPMFLFFPDECAEDGTDACLEYFKGEFDERIFWGTVYISPAERITDNHDERLRRRQRR